MKAAGSMLLGLALIAMSVPGSAEAPSEPALPATPPATLEEFLALVETLDPRIDMAQATRTDFAAPSGPFEVVIDGATGSVVARALDTLVTPSPDHGGAPAGCVTVGSFGGLATPPGVAPACPIQIHTTPINGAALICVAVTSCSMVLIGFAPSFGIAIVFCGVPAGVHIVGVGGTPNCSAFSFGSAPNTWTAWLGFVSSFPGLAVGVAAH